MKFFTPLVPDWVEERLDLEPGDAILAAAAMDPGGNGFAVGTRALFAVVSRLEPEGQASLPTNVVIAWEQIEEATWDAEAEVLRVVEIADYGVPRPTHQLRLEFPHKLLTLIRERVTSSIVFQRRVDLPDKGGFTIVGRRTPLPRRADQGINWMTALDAGVDPADTSLRHQIDAAIQQARSEVGEI